MNVKELIEMLSYEDVDPKATVRFKDIYREPGFHGPSFITGMEYGISVVLTNEELS